MKRTLPILLAILACCGAAFGQARTAERIVDVAFSSLNAANYPNGSVRHVIDGVPGTTPCQGGGSGAMAQKVSGVWSCSSLSGSVGTGDVLGPSSSVANQIVVFNGTSGKNIKTLNTSGFALLTSGVVTGVTSVGSGSVVLNSSPTITTPTLTTPIIASFASALHTHTNAAGGGQLNASTVFSAGTIPPARIISNALTVNKCLRLSSSGTIETAADDCGSGGGGSPGGTSGTIQFNSSSTFGGALNTSYSSVTGQLTFNQLANGNDTLYGLRATDSSPIGYWLRLRNAADNTDLFSVATTGEVFGSSTFLSKNISAPSTPASGNTVVWTDTTGKNLRAQDDTGQVTVTIRATACSGTDKVSSISSAGVVTCTADQGGSGTGVITLNTLTDSSQNFADVDDTNVTLAINSATSTHTFTIGWTGTLAKARQNAATVYNDAANTWSTGAQDFGAATSLILPKAAGASPTASADVRYDTTSHTLEVGVNGTNRTVAFTAGSQTFSDKTLDNSTTANLRDTLLTLQDNSDPTKTANFELSGITSGQNRVISIPDANSTTVIPQTAVASQWVRYIDSTGAQIRSQPSTADLTGTFGPTQGGTGQSAVAQGDLLFGDSTNSWARLSKSTSATRYLSNTGASNNPAWAQVDLTSGVTGVLPVANWSVLTTKGDIMSHNGTTSVRLGVGTNGFVLKANSATSTGLEWAAATASAGGSTTQLQYNSSGSLAGISGATSDGTNVTFGAGNIIIGSATSITPALGKLFIDSDDNKLYFGIDGSTVGEIFVSGLSAVNLASANVTGTLPLANGGTNQTSWTAGRCVQVNAGGTALEAAAAACGSGGSITGSDTHVLFFDGANTPAGEAGFTYNKTTDTATLAGGLIIGASGAGYFELAEGTAPTVVANRLTFAAPTDVTASGLLYILPSDTPSNGEQLTANISGTTVTLSWDAAGSGGTGDAVSVNGSAATDANFINTSATGTVPSVTWSLDTGATPDAVSISAIGVASLTEAGVITTGTQGIAGIKVLGHSSALGRLGQTFEITSSANFGGAAINTFSTTAGEAGLLDFNRSKSATKGTQSAVASGDYLGLIVFRGSDGTNFQDAAAVIANVDGTPGSGDMPGRLTFWTTPDASSTAVERWRISNAGHLLASTDNTVDIGATGATRPRDIFIAGSLNAQASGGGYIQLTEGSAPSLVANTVQHVAASDAPAGGSAYIWGAAAASGILRVANSSGTMTVTQDAGISHLASSTSADLRSVLSDETGTGAAVFVGGDIGAGLATTPSANDNDTSIATTAYVQTELTAYASDTKTLTNTTVDTEATGNVFTSSHKIWLPAAGCSNTTASSFWDLPTSTPAVAACVTGTNIQKGMLDFADTSGGFSAQTTLRLPTDFTGTIDADIDWTTTATSGNIEWSLSTICTATNATETDDPAFNTASTVVTAAPGVANRVQKSTITSVTITGCAADEVLHVKIFRDGNDAQDTLGATARLLGITLTVRRQQ